MDNKYILALDQGTSSTKSVIFDLTGKIITKATVSIKSLYPHAGFVEQHPIEIYDSVIESIRQCLLNLSKPEEVRKIITAGISNQRETLVLWDERGEPLYNAIVWQCKRSVDICQRLQDKGLNEEVNKKTGLIIDPYFSATKLIWLVENKKRIRGMLKARGHRFILIDLKKLFLILGMGNLIVYLVML